MSLGQSIYRKDLFSGKTIIVSGGGTGIGRATARELAALGATVVLCARTVERLNATRDEIERDGGSAFAKACNIRDPEAVRSFFEETVRDCGPIDGLVNNAGGQFMSPAAAIKPKGWNAVIETNLTGTFAMTQAAYHAGLRDRGGAIVNVVLDFWRGFPGMAHSSAARAGVANLTQTLALEWAPYAIRVNAVAPGLISSTGLQNYPEAVQASLASVSRSDIPAARMGTVSEIAAAIIFLLSPGAAFISGTTLAIDGGGSLYRHQGFTIPDHPAWPAHEIEEESP